MTTTPPRRPDTSDEELLADGWREIETELTDAQRVDRVAAELDLAFRTLADVEAGVTIFGSARLGEDAPEYAVARSLAARIVREVDATIITGGGPGIMEAANRGAADAGGRSVGLLIDLPYEEGANPYVGVPVPFHYFFTRKVAFVRYSAAFVAMPGGLGTLDELFEVLCLVQTGKIRRRPLVLFGTAFWGGLVDWLRERLVVEGVVSPGDVDLLHVTDDPDLVLELVTDACAWQRGEVAAD